MSRRQHRIVPIIPCHPLPPTVTYRNPLVSLHKALLNPYFWGVYVRGVVGWPAMRSAADSPHPITNHQWSPFAAALALWLLGTVLKQNFREHFCLDLWFVVGARVPFPVRLHASKISWPKKKHANSHGRKKTCWKHIVESAKWENISTGRDIDNMLVKTGSEGISTCQFPASIFRCWTWPFQLAEVTIYWKIKKGDFWIIAIVCFFF